MALTKKSLLFAISLFLPLLLASWADSGADSQEKKPAPPPLPARFTSDHVAAKYHQLSLTQIVTLLDKTTGLNVLIDGEPLTPRADVEFDGTLEEALNKVADTFDYNWKVGKGGIVLFNKRFGNKDDIPQAGLVEMTHLIQNINGIFGRANVDPDPSKWNLYVSRLGQSFTEKQWAALLTRKRMPASALNPEQFAQLRAAIMNNMFARPVKAWADLAERVRNLKTTYLIGHRLPDDPTRPGAAPEYSYELVWRNRDGSLSSENISTKFFTSQ